MSSTVFINYLKGRNFVVYFQNLRN